LRVEVALVSKKEDVAPSVVVGDFSAEDGASLTETMKEEALSVDQVQGNNFLITMSLKDYIVDYLSEVL
jgi:hypothetical protein